MTIEQGLPAALRTAGLFVVPAAVAAVDGATKQIALAQLFVPGRIIEVLPFMNLVPVWNTGVSFGLLSGAGVYAPLLLAAFALAVGMFLPLYTRSWAQPERTGASLMAGGAIGNAIDRLLYGKVVDFLDFHAGGWHWPAFNVADIAIVVGAALILYGSIGINLGRNSSNGDPGR